MVSVLFVCLGNICRSPTAEGVFRHLVEHEGLADHFTIDSAGTAAYHVGSPPDSRAQAEAKRRGIDISGLRARQARHLDFTQFDYILAMDQENHRNLITAICWPFAHRIMKIGCICFWTSPRTRTAATCPTPITTAVSMRFLT
ncbi:MAG: protein-tyrosine phosphatase [Rhodobacteraceae bacterium]|nr:MAG: protein-tyrosine phosphatase [Paracoccaceae bacterium]